jgi:hypothetical protein
MNLFVCEHDYSSVPLDNVIIYDNLPECHGNYRSSLLHQKDTKNPEERARESPQQNEGVVK